MGPASRTSRCTAGATQRALVVTVAVRCTPLAPGVGWRAGGTAGANDGGSHLEGDGFQVDPRVRSILGDHRLVGSREVGAAAGFPFGL
jgi:hypothetical protein